MKIHASTRQSQQDEKAKQRTKNFVLIAIGFGLGFVISSATILNAQVLLDRLEETTRIIQPQPFVASTVGTTTTNEAKNDGTRNSDSLRITTNTQPQTATANASSLQDVRILVAIAAFDFNQIPHLEEVLDSGG